MARDTWTTLTTRAGKPLAIEAISNDGPGVIGPQSWKSLVCIVVNPYERRTGSRIMIQYAPSPCSTYLLGPTVHRHRREDGNKSHSLRETSGLSKHLQDDGRTTDLVSCWDTEYFVPTYAWVYNCECHGHTACIEFPPDCLLLKWRRSLPPQTALDGWMEARTSHTKTDRSFWANQNVPPLFMVRAGLILPLHFRPAN
jgi:hypothetical protein